MRRRLIAPIAVVLAVSLAACSGGNSADNVVQPKEDLSQENLNDPSTPDPDQEAAAATCKEAKKVVGRAPRVVSTVAPITNLIGLMVAGTSVEVNGIVPEGTNSVVEKADVIFVNGLGLEDPTLELAEANAKNSVVCELGTATMPKGSWIFDFSFPMDGGKPNPHVWTSPFLVLGYLNVIRDAVVALDPDNMEIFDANYITMVTALGGDAAALKAIKADIGLVDKAYYPQ